MIIRLIKQSINPSFL